MRINREDVLDQCLEAMAGGKSLEEVLRSCPEEAAADLRPLLQLAAELRALPEPAPIPHGLMRAMVQAAIPEQGFSRSRKSDRVTFWCMPVLVRMAASLVAAFLLLWGISAASSQAIPGDLMYPLKRFTEKVRFFLTLNGNDEAELRIVFSERRLAEALKKYQRKGEMDERLVRAMFNEARMALEESVSLAPEERCCLLSQIDHLTAHQQSVIHRLQNQAPPPVQKAIAPLAEMCSRRMEWMDEMMMQMGMSGHGGKAARGDQTGGTEQPSEASPGTIDRTNRSGASGGSMREMMHMGMPMHGAKASPGGGNEKQITNSSSPSPASMKEWMERCPMWQK